MKTVMVYIGGIGVALFGAVRGGSLHDGLKCGPSQAQHTAEAWPEEGDRDGEESGDSVT